jgi:hypothetical protein
MINFGLKLLRLLESSFKSVVEISHTINLSIPILFHAFVFITYLSDQSKGKFKDMKSSLLWTYWENILISMMKFHWRYSNGTDWILHSPFMRLIHEIPYINSTIWLTNEADTSPTRSPTTWCMEAAFAYHAWEKWDLNSW